MVRVEVAQLGIDPSAWPTLMFIDTPLVRDGDRQRPDLARMRSMLRGPAGSPVSMAADALVRGIERRARQVFVPGSLRYQRLLRGVIKPVIDREFQQHGGRPAVQQKVRERGSFPAAFNCGTLAARERRAADGDA